MIQATIRNGNTLHIQAGSPGNYRKADVAVPSTIATIILAAIASGVNTVKSLYGSGTQYVAAAFAEAGFASFGGVLIQLPASLGETQTQALVLAAPTATEIARPSYVAQATLRDAGSVLHVQYREEGAAEGDYRKADFEVSDDAGFLKDFAQALVENGYDVVTSMAGTDTLYVECDFDGDNAEVLGYSFAN